jgi:heterodisulfide reductase subunit E
MTEGLPIGNKEVFDTLFVDYRIMVTVAVISVIIFLVGMYLQLAKWGRGIPEGATKPLGAWGTLKLIVHRIFEKGIGAALGIIILDALFQRRTWRRRKTEWLMHILLFWGFFGLFILTVAAAAAEFYGPFIKGEPAGQPQFFIETFKVLKVPNLIFATMLTIGIIIAAVRRLAFADVPPARWTSIDWISIGGLSIVIITGFLAYYLRLDVYNVAGRMLISSVDPTIQTYAAVSPAFFNNPTVLFHEVFTLLFCVAYLPFSKLFHMFVTPLVIMINKGGM